MAEHTSVGAARGYSWQPFQPGHELTMKHGAWSKRRWKPIADRLVAEHLAEHPWHSGYRQTVEAMCAVRARKQLLGDWLDAEGMWDEDGNLRLAELTFLDRLEAREQSLRKELVMDPMGQATLYNAWTSAVGTGNEDVVAGLAARGSAFVEVWQAAEAHGCWPAGLLNRSATHCRDCHRSWTGRARAHCVVCHELFSTNGTADRHWLKGGHRHPSTVGSLRQGDDGVWRSAGESPWVRSALSADERAAQIVGMGADTREAVSAS